MANAKEIRTQIKSIRNTAKITKAMEMVAAAKMRKAQERMEASRPYAERIRTVIGHLMQARPDYRHPFMVEREAKRVGYIIVSSDRGLCGGLNANLFRRTLRELREWRDKGVEVELCLVGRKAAQFFRRLDVNIVASLQDLGDVPRVQDLIGAIQVMLNEYSEGSLDRLFLVHNEFVNTMSQKPVTLTLLPAQTQDAEELQTHWDYIYEPSSTELVEQVLTRYIESQVYRGAVENVACEMAARMVAMKSATDNAGKLIDGLQLAYNKARQAAITQELAEIVGGAAAV
ncbi:F0F1 ATP synthase subunit gamma [Thioalkalivibrio sp. XN279]|uniref:F0F1 ATP synthase subunit gamma n=1 Tax=Thioalkalivibrio sp. XN279 TaxID=2714953 RepID=UPI00140E7EE0|nr:F0F1 ATP synthase subunit gamma [Thioalkalivibrio sp. XN279]NHA15783.1 F0F1 ATP synthase subunit gamma [Thioalkalivibrio sp. XN279]